MLSTLLTYRTYATNIGKTLERVQQASTVAADAKYYEENIGKVETAEEFLDDYKLYSYALKAYGLEEQISSKGFVRKVIESDLTDTTSFANVLADSRYRTFAAAFNFAPAGAAPTAPQSNRQLGAMVEAYSEHRVRLGSTLAAKTSYFQTEIAKVETVADLVGNTVLFEIAMRSIGADPELISKSYVRDVFLGIIDDNPSSDSDNKFFALADRFNFDADGLLADGDVALDPGAVSEMISQYNIRMGNTNSAAAAAHEQAYYTEQVALGEPIDDFLGDPRVFEYLRRAFVLPPTISAALVRNVLTSDVSDPSSFVNTMALTKNNAYPDYELRLREMRDAFDFSPAGTAPSGGAQTAEKRDGVIDRFLDNYRFEANKDDEVKISRFTDLLFGRIKSVSELLANSVDFDTDAMEFALKAFDIDPATVSITKVRRALQSDVSDPNSYVNKLGDQRFVDLAAAFNFDAEGKIRPERVVQSASDQTATGSRYRASFGTEVSKAKQEVITAETRKYLETVAELRTLEEFFDSDTVVEYALTAYGLDDENLTMDELRKIFASDMTDPESYANSLGDRRYVDLVSAFNFGADGRVMLEEGGAQSGADLYSTQNLYLLTTLEQQVGETSEGGRLALYFLRKAPDVTTTLQLLADPAMVEVVRTALGLPASISQLDLDKQAALIEKRLDIADFKDTRKLDTFISRFAALYDLNNIDATQSSPILGLFSGGEASGGLLAIL